MSDHKAAVEEFESAYAALFQLIERCPVVKREQPGACGTWSAREVLAHCSGWMVELQRRYDHYDAGNLEGIRYDFDTFNAGSVNERAALDWDETVSELRARVQAAITRAQALSPEVTAANDRYDRWLRVLAEDCREHTDGLQAFVEA